MNKIKLFSLFNNIGRKSGFTLIELLVVISIIGMLSSVILVSVQSARDKGVVGAGLKFATYNYRAFGADAIFYTNFDSNLQNTSQNNFVLTTNSGASNPGISPTGSGASLNVTGTGPKYLLSSAVSVSGFTASAWIKPAGDGYILYANPIDGPDSSTCVNATTNGRLVSLYYDFNNGKMLQLAVGKTNNVFYTAAGSVPLNKWTHVAYSYSSTGGHNVYINGSKVSGTTSDIPNLSLQCVQLGSMGSGATSNAGNYIDDVVIYSQALAQADIQKIYAEGLPEHNLASQR